MSRAIVANAASKAAITGGSFADVLSANSGDTLTIPNLQSGHGKVLRMWGNDSDSILETALTAGRVDSVHDPTYGIRFNTPATTYNNVGANGGFPMIEPPNWIDVFTGDTLTFTITGTASDDVAVVWLTEYQNLPGVQAWFTNWQALVANKFTQIGIRCAPVASGTVGAWGATRAANADETRWTGGRWYGLIGVTVQTPVTAVSFKGPMWGNFRFAIPCGTPFLPTDNYFVQLQQLYPSDNVIPVFNGYDAGSVLLEVCDTEASTNPKVDILAVECINNPAVPS